jgi:benzoyl-CoA 2,3-dioxygenase component B
LKGRYKEQDQYEDHIVAEQDFTMKVVEQGQLKEREVAMRNALNEVLRTEYVKDCEKGLARWNKTLAEEGITERLFLPNSRFHRHLGEYAGHHFDLVGNLITAEEFEQRKTEWLPTMADREYVRSLMHPVVEPGKIANWIAPPATGIKGKPFEFEYVRL